MDYLMGDTVGMITAVNWHARYRDGSRARLICWTLDEYGAPVGWVLAVSAATRKQMPSRADRVTGFAGYGHDNDG